MDPLPAAAAISVMVAVFLGLLALQQMSTSGRGPRERLNTLFGAPVVERPLSKSSLLREDRTGSVFGLGSLISGKEWADKAALDLDRADLSLRVGEYVALRVGLGLFLAAIALVLVQAQPVSILLAVALAAVGYMVPPILVSRRKKARVAKLDSQLEEALTLSSNSLKAGFGLLQALEMAADQLAHPISTELRRTIRDINIGSSTEEALLDLSKRCGSYDLDIVVTAIMIQRGVGGNLAEILDTVAHTMRERVRIRGEIRTLTSQQQLTGLVIGLLPVAIGGILAVTSWEYIGDLFVTVPGQVMLAGAAVLEFLGILLIKRILAIEV